MSTSEHHYCVCQDLVKSRLHTRGEALGHLVKKRSSVVEAVSEFSVLGPGCVDYVII